MTAPRDLVTCQKCGAVLGKVGRYVGLRKGQEAQQPQHWSHREPPERDKPKPKNVMTLKPNVVFFVVMAERVDVICPECGYCRAVRPDKFPIVTRETA